MQAAVKVHLFQTLEETKTPKKEKWVKENPGQCLIRLARVTCATKKVLRIFVCYFVDYNR